jgi:hypothetical protein
MKWKIRNKMPKDLRAWHRKFVVFPTKTKDGYRVMLETVWTRAIVFTGLAYPLVRWEYSYNKPV